MLESKFVGKYVLHLYVLWSMKLLIDLIFSGLVAENSVVANKFSITVGVPVSVFFFFWALRDVICCRY